MKRHRHLEIFCTSLAVLLLEGCSGQPAQPTAPSGLGTTAAASVAGTSGASAQTERLTVASAPAPSPATANFEIKFMTDMIDHHYMAVMMA